MNTNPHTTAMISPQQQAAEPTQHEKFKAEFSDALAAMTDEEIVEWFGSRGVEVEINRTAEPPVAAVPIPEGFPTVVIPEGKIGINRGFAYRHVGGDFLYAKREWSQWRRTGSPGGIGSCFYIQLIDAPEEGEKRYTAQEIVEESINESAVPAPVAAKAPEMEAAKAALPVGWDKPMMVNTGADHVVGVNLPNGRSVACGINTGCEGLSIRIIRPDENGEASELRFAVSMEGAKALHDVLCDRLKFIANGLSETPAPEQEWRELGPDERLKRSDKVRELSPPLDTWGVAGNLEGRTLRGILNDSGESWEARRRVTAPAPVEARGIQADGREFETPLAAAVHFLKVFSILSHWHAPKEGMPCDGPRFREGIIEARKFLAALEAREGAK